jgi:hypothetical protein
MITSRREKVISQLKLDMIAIYISTAEATAWGHSKRVKEENKQNDSNIISIER